MAFITILNDIVLIYKIILTFSDLTFCFAKNNYFFIPSINLPFKKTKNEFLNFRNYFCKINVMLHWDSST